jgi:hypothetical protein
MSTDWFKVAMEESAKAAYYKDLLEIDKVARGSPTDFLKWEDLPEDKWKASYRFKSKVNLTYYYEW